MPLILGFDTSNSCSSVAITSGQQLLVFFEELRPHMQAERILVLIEMALKQAKLKYQDLDYLVTTRGPDSFTSIRIALATATGISMGAKNIKPFAVSNFQLSHYRAIEQVSNCSKIVILLNAHRSQVYLQEFDQTEQQSEAQLMDIEDALQLLRSCPKNTAIAGNALQIIASEIMDMDHLIILPRFPRIKAVHLCRYADEYIKSGKQLHPLQPLYIRPPDAKISTKLITLSNKFQ